MVQAIPVPKQKFTHVHMDLVGPLSSSSRGHTHLLTIVDRTTRWPEVVPLHSISDEVCMDAFVDTWVACHGVRQQVTTDRGAQFTGSEWGEMCQQLGIQHRPTTAYHPQSNGMVERFHRQLKDGLRARCEGKDWLSHLPYVLLGLRAAPKEEADISSAEVTFGAPLVLPLQMHPEEELRGTQSPEVQIPNTTRTYAEVLRGGSNALQEADYVYVWNGAHHVQRPIQDSTTWREGPTTPSWDTCRLGLH